MAASSRPTVVPNRSANGECVRLTSAPFVPVYARRFTQAHRAMMPNDRYLGDAIRADREPGRYGR